MKLLIRLRKKGVQPRGRRLDQYFRGHQQSDKSESDPHDSHGYLHDFKDTKLHRCAAAVKRLSQLHHPPAHSLMKMRFLYIPEETTCRTMLVR
jgi:hypothetical protein